MASSSAEGLMQAGFQDWKDMMLPGALLLRSASSGMVCGYSDAADLLVSRLHADLGEYSRCVSAIVAAGNPAGAFNCYFALLSRLGEHGIRHWEGLCGIMARSAASIICAQIDGSYLE